MCASQERNNCKRMEGELINVGLVQSQAHFCFIFRIINSLLKHKIIAQDN